MIRVGMSKPKLYYSKGHNDMSHYFPSCWETNDYFFMTPEEYEEKLEFDSFDMNPDLESDPELKNCLDVISRGEDLDLEQCKSTHLREMSRLLNKSKHLIWEFNATNKTQDGYIRGIVFLGGNQLTRWTWIDTYIKLPILQFLSKILNGLNKSRAEKECRDWEEFLTKGNL